MASEEPIQAGPESLHRVIDLAPGLYLFRIGQGEAPMRIVREDGSAVELTDRKEEVVHLSGPETVIVRYQANGHPPAIQVVKVR